MIMNKFHFNENKEDIWKCDWLIGHMISITKVKIKSKKMVNFKLFDLEKGETSIKHIINPK